MGTFVQDPCRVTFAVVFVTACADWGAHIGTIQII